MDALVLGGKPIGEQHIRESYASRKGGRTSVVRIGSEAGLPHRLLELLGEVSSTGSFP